MATIREDFVTFINKGNLIQLAIAFVIGAAFAALITALVSDFFTPLIGAAGGFNFSSWKFVLNGSGSTIMQGAFLNSIISFIIIALVVFFAIALPYQRYQDRQVAKARAVPPTTKTCPACFSTINIQATRCAFCTSTVPLTPAAPAA